MRYNLTLEFLIVLMFPALALEETVEWKGMDITDGLHYQKFTDIPFSGKVTGKEQGSFKNGVKVK